MDINKSYRKHGAILSMTKRDAFSLIGRGIGKFDSIGDIGELTGVCVPGEMIDRVELGELPKLYLLGGFIIVRGNVDVISPIRKSIDITGLFD